MARAAAPELSPWSERLARLFAQAGLLSEAELRQFEERTRKVKSMIEVLNQDAFSLETFRDLFFRAELNPFRQSSPLRGALAKPFALTQSEIAQLLAHWKPELKTAIQWLEQCGAVHGGTLGEGVRQAELTVTDPHEWLGRDGWITPGVIQKFAESGANPLPRLCALAMAVYVLEHGGATGGGRDKGFPGKRLSWDNHEEIEKELRARIGLASSALIERIEAGLDMPSAHPDKAVPDESLAAMFPAEFMKRRQFFPLRRGAGHLDLAMSDPLDLSLAVLLKWLTGNWIRPFYLEAGVIETILTRSPAAEKTAAEPDRKPKTERESMKESKRTKPDGDGAARNPTPADAPTAGGKSTPAVKDASKMPRVDAPTDNLSAVQLVSSIVESAIDLGATDIHFEPNRENMTVRFRLDGQLNKILNIPQNLVGPVTSRLKVLASLDVTERRRPQDGHIALDMGGRHFDFRIATLPAAWGEKMAIRILDSQRVMTGLDKTGLSGAQLETVRRLIQHPYGIVLVTGPTGSGKTSTLYAALQALNSEERHLVTIEDPIEYQLDGINQVEVDPTVGLTFSEGLRAILRQDPNVIMVGEIRDPDTAMTAIRAAMTGHLVFSTLHTNTAIGAFQALANMGASPYMMGSAVSGVIAQRLVRRLCLKCRKASPVPAALARDLAAKVRPEEQWFEAVGCGECLGSGYSGRTGIFEVIEMTEKLRKGVMANDPPDRLLEIASGDGRVSIAESALALVRSGVTSADEVLKKVILN